MQSIEHLKEEEKQQMWEDGVSAETVEYLKVSEEDVEPSHPIPAARQPFIRVRRDRVRKLARIAAIGAGVWAVYALVTSGVLFGNWWALFLLLPILKNVQTINEDRRSGMVTPQTKRYISGVAFGTLFTVMFLANAWSFFVPGLIGAWLTSKILYNRWRNEPVLV